MKILCRVQCFYAVFSKKFSPKEMVVCLLALMVDEDTLVPCFYAVFSEEFSLKEVVVYLHALKLDEDTSSPWLTKFRRRQ